MIKAYSQLNHLIIMAKNVSKNKHKSSATYRPSRGIFAFFDRVFNMDKILGGKFPASQLRYVVWISGLIVIYITSYTWKNIMYICFWIVI